MCKTDICVNPTRASSLYREMHGLVPDCMERLAFRDACGFDRSGFASEAKNEEVNLIPVSISGE